MAETLQQQNTESAMNFDPAILLKKGDCRFVSDHGGEVKLNIENVRMIAITGEGVTITNAEALIFIRMCETWKLDPFLKEIYLTKYKQSQPAAAIVAADAFLAKVDRDPSYGGFETGWICDEGGKGRACLDPKTAIKPNQNIIGAWCQVYRQNRKTPVHQTLTVEVRKLDRNGKPFPIWDSMPQTMTMKCVIAQAHRKVYPNALAGLYSSDEFYDMATTDKPQETFDEAQISAEQEIESQMGQTEVAETIDSVADDILPVDQQAESDDNGAKDMPDVFKF